MPDSVTAEIERLRQSIAGLEARRAILGEAVIEPALQALRHQIADLEALITVPAPSAEERRILTIFYSDVIGSTTLAEKLDPEEWLLIIGRVQQTIGNIIAEHHGLVAQYQGDGLIAFFGMPQGSESDPENAIRAGLAAQQAVPELKLSLPVQIRVGIHTGLVAIGAWGSLSKIELGAFGDAMNVGARLQTACPPGSVLITNDTYRLVQGIFDASPQPLLTVKGRTEPLQTFLISRARPRSSRTVTRGVMGITSPIVGRESELARFRQEIDTAYQSRKIIWIQIEGEAGIGKSRMLNEICKSLEHDSPSVHCIRARAFEGDQKQAFGLVRRLLFDSLEISEDTPLARAEAIWVERFLAVRGAGFEESAHALGLLAGLPFLDSPYIGAMRNDPVQIKGRAVVVGRELTTAMRMTGPITILLDDLQWADSSSLDYIIQIVLDSTVIEDHVPHGAAIIAAARSEWRPPSALAQFEGYRQIELAALDDIAGHELVTNLLKNVSGVTGKEIDLVVERAEGVPYFAEELINWFLDNGIINASKVPWQFDAARLSESAIPATLQHLISTRLGTLRERERVILQRGSIFGRHFWEGGLAALGAQDSNPVLVQLQPRNFVERQSTCAFAGEIEWSFHHNLLREVTYESVLKRERKTLHRQAADWLTAQAGKAQRLDELAGVIAEHLDRAGASDPAAIW
ncbi:MAG TPA: adenylate/guanylate cyclase domain-containing protein, partial [Anaerolineae bacterium]